MAKRNDYWMAPNCSADASWLSCYWWHYTGSSSRVRRSLNENISGAAVFVSIILFWIESIQSKIQNITFHRINCSWPDHLCYFQYLLGTWIFLTHHSLTITEKWFSLVFIDIHWWKIKCFVIVNVVPQRENQCDDDGNFKGMFPWWIRRYIWLMGAKLIRLLYKNGTQIVQKFTSLILDEIESDITCDRVVLRDSH